MKSTHNAPLEPLKVRPEYRFVYGEDWVWLIDLRTKKVMLQGHSIRAEDIMEFLQIRYDQKNVDYNDLDKKDELPKELFNYYD